MIERAVVLAAGRGSRLGSLTDATPKPLIEVGGHSMISHVLAGIRDAGVYEVVVVTGYRSADLEDHIWGFSGLSIRFARQDNPRGTAHALGVASRYLRDRMFLFTWADVLVDASTYQRVILAAETADAVLAVNEVPDPSVGAAVFVDDEGWVTDIVEKPPPGTSATNWNNSGVGVLGPEAWRVIDRLEPSIRGELELTDALAAMVNQGRQSPGRARYRPLVRHWYACASGRSKSGIRRPGLRIVAAGTRSTSWLRHSQCSPANSELNSRAG